MRFPFKTLQKTLIYAQKNTQKQFYSQKTSRNTIIIRLPVRNNSKTLISTQITLKKHVISFLNTQKNTFLPKNSEEHAISFQNTPKNNNLCPEKH